VSRPVHPPSSIQYVPNFSPPDRAVELIAHLSDVPKLRIKRNVKTSFRTPVKNNIRPRAYFGSTDDLDLHGMESTTKWKYVTVSSETS